MFELSRRAGRALAAMAQETGTEQRTAVFDAQTGKDASLTFFAENMFSYSAAQYAGEDCALELVCA